MAARDFRIIEYMNGQCEAQVGLDQRPDGKYNVWKNVDKTIYRYNNKDEAQDAIDAYKAETTIKKIYEVT